MQLMFESVDMCSVVEGKKCMAVAVKKISVGCVLLGMSLICFGDSPKARILGSQVNLLNTLKKIKYFRSVYRCSLNLDLCLHKMEDMLSKILIL